MKLHEKIRNLREDKDLRQIDIAQILQLSQSGYMSKENGKRKFTDTEIVILSEYFNVSTDYLLGRSSFKTDAEKQSNFESVAQVFLDKHNGDIAAAIKELMDELEKRKK